MPLHVAKETEQELEAKVRSGAYPSVDRLIREGLALIEAREVFRRAVSEGDAQLARGETVTQSESRRRMRKLAREFPRAR
jgi:Arc/MetJ-type ribon-helix-helix transcriptional regulator